LSGLQSGRSLEDGSRGAAAEAELYVEEVGGNKGYDLSSSVEDDELRPRARVPVTFTTNDTDIDLAGGFVGRDRLASGVLVESPVGHVDRCYSRRGRGTTAAMAGTESERHRVVAGRSGGGLVDPDWRRRRM
jgi:hypothetical protein